MCTWCPSLRAKLIHLRLIYDMLCFGNPPSRGGTLAIQPLSTDVGLWVLEGSIDYRGCRGGRSAWPFKTSLHRLNMKQISSQWTIRIPNLER